MFFRDWPVPSEGALPSSLVQHFVDEAAAPPPSCRGRVVAWGAVTEAAASAAGMVMVARGEVVQEAGGAEAAARVAAAKGEVMRVEAARAEAMRVAANARQ